MNILRDRPIILQLLLLPISDKDWSSLKVVICGKSRFYGNIYNLFFRKPIIDMKISWFYYPLSN